MNAPLAKTNSRNSVSSVRRPLPRRSSLVCAECETLVQAPVASHIIDKGIPTTGLLAQVLVAEATKYLLAVGPVAAEPSAPAAKAVTATSAQWLVGVFEANIVGAKGNARYRFQCTSASEPCTLSIQDDRFPVNSQRPEPLDLAVPLDSGPANAALAHTREIARGDPSLFNEQSADGDSLRSLRRLLTSKDTLADCVDLDTQKAGPLYISACMRSSDRRARDSLVLMTATMAGAPSALGKRPFQYLSFIELRRTSH